MAPENNATSEEDFQSSSKSNLTTRKQEARITELMKRNKGNIGIDPIANLIDEIVEGPQYACARAGIIDILAKRGIRIEAIGHGQAIEHAKESIAMKTPDAISGTLIEKSKGISQGEARELCSPRRGTARGRIHAIESISKRNKISSEASADVCAEEATIKKENKDIDRIPA